MKIQVRIRNVYGRELIYPVCEKAKTFAELAKQSTLTMFEINKIKSLGYTVEVVADVKTL